MKYTIVVVIVGGLIANVSGCVAGRATGPENPIVAVVDGERITLRDIDTMVQGELQRIHNQENEIRHQALESAITQRVVAAEAERRGLSIQGLLELKAKEGGAQAGGTIRHESIEQYVESLRSRAKVTILLPRSRSLVAVDADRVRGSIDAAVTIVEFSDFQCPYCKASQETLKAILAKYQDRVRLAYRDWPIDDSHPQAHLAAAYARCAGEQGRFWEYHDLLFSEQTKLDKANLLENARSLHLDQHKFNACAASDKFESKIQLDYQEGQAAGVSGTPTFFINGIVLTGAQPLSAFEKIIDSELASVSSSSLKPAVSRNSSDVIPRVLYPSK